MRNLRWIGGCLALAVGCGCSLLSPSGANTSSNSNASPNPLFQLPTLDLQAVSKVKDAIDKFKELNSSQGNFTMPIGNNFTMPIGNNFTMPIGNNLVGNSASALVGNSAGAYRIQDLQARTSIPFGFVPFSKDDVSGVDGTMPTELTKQVATVANATSNLDATVELSWWANDTGTTGYDDHIHYNNLKMAAAGDANVTGDYHILIAGDNWTQNNDKYGGFLVLGDNANPATVARRKDRSTLSVGGSPVVDMTLVQDNFKTFTVPVLKTLAPTAADIHIPGTVSVDGKFTKADQSKAMAVSLAATSNIASDFSTAQLTVGGWLHPCGAGEAAGCTASAASSATGGAGEIREDYALDFKTLSSKLTFESKAGSTGYGFRYTLYYSYADALARGIGGTSALTGDLSLVDADGKLVPGGKLADIRSDADGNPLLIYSDDTAAKPHRESWKL